MIPKSNKKLLVAEDWTKIYKSFSNADFQSYDFETLRRTMVNYLRENFPEDFNDYIESSEYIALVDLIAFLGQNLSFRIDLNAKENFLETAQRRDSILRLAQLISYNPSRNIPAHGFLKVVAISTTDTVIDLNGNNLADTTISWNDPTNPDWYQQFLTIINSTLIFEFGKSNAKKTIDGVVTEEYQINTYNEDVPIFNFNATVDGTNMTFDVVPSSIVDKDYIYEKEPLPASSFGIIYKNDYKGLGSSNSGFFLQFRQGNITVSNFNISNPVPNEIIGVNAVGINNTDIWLWQLDKQGNYDKLWTKVDSVAGNNIIYNSVSKGIRTFYAVTSRDNDQIDLNFADGVFGDLPKGQFRLFYRQSNGLSYSIKPEQLSGIIVSIPYLNKFGQPNTLNLTLSLQYNVSNSSGSETNEEIKQKAPQIFYSQNRMITGEDYNIIPLKAGSNIVKVKSVNRVSSGISKYFDLSDVSGYYGKTNIFASDGILYKEFQENITEFEFGNSVQNLGNIKKLVSTIVADNFTKSFYFDKFDRISLTSLNLKFKLVNKLPGESRGYFYNDNGPYIAGADLTDNNLKYISPDSLVKFTAPEGYYFNETNSLVKLDSAQKGFDILEFVNSAKGNYSFKEYYVKTLNLLPLYTGNSLYQTSLGERYGLYRDPDYAGLKYWVDQALLYNIDINDQITLDTFFTAAASYQLDRSTISSKVYYYIDQVPGVGESPIVSKIEIPEGGRLSIWSKVVQQIGDGASLLDDGTGPLIFNSFIPDGAIPTEIIPSYQSILSFSLENEINNQCNNFRNFGLTINNISRTWDLITNSNLNLTESFSLAFQENLEDQGLDSSWLIAFVWTGHSYKIRSRSLNYIFESEKETTFFVDKTSINYDFTNNTVIKDKIDILSFNTSPESLVSPLNYNRTWQIEDEIVEPDGYVFPNRIKVSFYNYGLNNGIDPDSFVDVVGNNYIFLKKNNEQLYEITDDEIIILDTEADLTNSMKIDNNLFYIKNLDVCKIWSSSLASLVFTDEYLGKVGRSKLKFHYLHNSGKQRRIDPSKSNIIDVYLLTKDYDSSFKAYLQGFISEEPLAPTSQSLDQNYGEYLENYKSISDEIIFHHVKYKVLFGPKAVPSLQAMFKAVRNPTRNINDNNLKSRIFYLINEFFNLDNVEFGQTFNFTELSTYVMNYMTPDIINFVIVPMLDNSFGSLFEIKCSPDEVFVNGTTIDNIEIVSALSSNQLKSSSNIITST